MVYVLSGGFPLFDCGDRGLPHVVRQRSGGMLPGGTDGTIGEMLLPLPGVLGR
jgi:hypothetical protein